MKEYLDIFFTFLRMGAFTFGGGYAMLPMLEREIVQNKKWATSEEIMDYFAVGQCTPGVIAVNTSTFIGYKLKGIKGGVVATLGFITPSFIIISIIAVFMNNFSHLKVVQSAFWGIRVCVCVLMIESVKKMIKGGVIDMITGFIFVLTFLGMMFWLNNPVLYVIAGAVIGLLLCEKVRKKGESK
ncbi:MAG: chromate transporter [Anaerostipes sp.]|jgi:chromate transporter|nr:chromate transporter [Anaerostipes sp.]